MPRCGNSPAAGLTALCLGLQAAVARASSCAYRFASFPNVSDLPVWNLPASLPWGPETSTFGGENHIVYLADDGTEEADDCTGDSWRYQAADGEWKTELSFPATWESSDAAPMVSFEGFFNATGDGEVTVSGIPTSIAPAVSDSLYGRNIEFALTCNQEDPAVMEEDSCVLFQVDFMNYSPTFDVNMALFRFEDPAVPGIEMPLAQPLSPGDTQLNEGNPIVELDGSEVSWGCNGDMAEYQGEDGEWYFWYTGSDGQRYNLTHVFYTTDFDQLHIATIQSAWSPNLEAALHNRYVRLLIHCSNQVNHEDGYLIFKVGGQDFDESCDDHWGLCVDDGPDDDTDSGVRCETCIGLAYVLTFVVGMLSLLLVLD
ncbi:unnamed protein product [Ectocarpus sp. 12 AP-2014]